MGIILYGVIYVVLIVSTILELIVIRQPLSPQLIYTSIVGLAGLKAVLIAMFYQHLVNEPRPLSSFAIMGLLSATIFMVMSIGSIIYFLGG